MLKIIILPFRFVLLVEILIWKLINAILTLERASLSLAVSFSRLGGTVARKYTSICISHTIFLFSSYPTSAGGGCKKLFRKIGNRSSEFYPDINEVRRDGSYIYEEFVETQGTDVKMYTVGPEYGHAEARKSPTVDGKVERNSEGKEGRLMNSLLDIFLLC